MLFDNMGNSTIALSPSKVNILFQRYLRIYYIALIVMHYQTHHKRKKLFAQVIILSHIMNKPKVRQKKNSY